MYELVPDRPDFETRDREQEEWFKHRPKCIWCGERIQDEFAVQIAEDFYCDSCIDSMRVAIGD